MPADSPSGKPSPKSIEPPPEQAPEAAREVLRALAGLADRELSITERFSDKTRQVFALAIGFFTIVQTVAFNSFQENQVHALERKWLFALAIGAIAFLFATALVTILAERLVTVKELDVTRLLDLLQLANAGDASAFVYLAQDYAAVVKSQRESNDLRRRRYRWTVRMAGISILITTIELISALAFRI